MTVQYPPSVPAGALACAEPPRTPAAAGSAALPISPTEARPVKATLPPLQPFFAFVDLVTRTASRWENENRLAASCRRMIPAISRPVRARAREVVLSSAAQDRPRRPRLGTVRPPETGDSCNDNALKGTVLGPGVGGSSPSSGTYGCAFLWRSSMLASRRLASKSTYKGRVSSTRVMASPGRNAATAAQAIIA